MSQDRLTSNAVGVWGLVFFVVAAAAPLTVMAAQRPARRGSGQCRAVNDRHRE